MEVSSNVFLNLPASSSLFVPFLCITSFALSALVCPSFAMGGDESGMKVRRRVTQTTPAIAPATAPPTSLIIVADSTADGAVVAALNAGLRSSVRPVRAFVPPIHNVVEDSSTVGAVVAALNAGLSSSVRPVRAFVPAIHNTVEDSSTVGAVVAALNAGLRSSAHSVAASVSAPAPKRSDNVVGKTLDPDMVSLVEEMRNIQTDTVHNLRGVNRGRDPRFGLNGLDRSVTIRNIPRQITGGQAGNVRAIGPEFKAPEVSGGAR